MSRGFQEGEQLPEPVGFDVPVVERSPVRAMLSRWSVPVLAVLAAVLASAWSLEQAGLWLLNAVAGSVATRAEGL